MIIQRKSIRLIHHHSIDSGVGLDTTMHNNNHSDLSLSPLVDKNNQPKGAAVVEDKDCGTANAQKSSSARRTSSSSKRCVRFDLSCNTLQTVEPPSEDELQQRWFGTKDTRNFRKSAALVGKQAMLSTPANDSKSSFKAILCQLLIAANRQTGDDEGRANDDDGDDALSEWEERYVSLMQQKPELLGLERFALDASTKDKRRRRREQFVAMQQYLASPSPSPSPSCSFLDETNAAYALSTCERISRPGRRFAQRLALIQAAHL